MQSLVHDPADRKMVAAALAACQRREPCVIAFDLYDQREQAFWARARRAALCAESGLASAPERPPVSSAWTA
ncbi:MAG: hypothetical protein EOM24_23635 [Chloroflexia bacterium]|nr:hypothetical protein [Chloroflexia bacterium]